MKTRYIFTVFTLLSLLPFSSCRDVIFEKSYRNVPVYMSYEEMRSAVVHEAPSGLKNPGKIYFKDGYIFINEEMKGVHIIDNRDPANPVNTGFIAIPGNMDIAIKGSILYADSYVDLVAVDISDLDGPKEVSRVKDVFPYTLPPLADETMPVDVIDKEKGVVAGWEVKLENKRVESGYFPVYRSGWLNAKYDYATMPERGPGMNGTSFGIGGSMARFALYGDHLYAVDNRQFHIFDTENEAKPLLVNEPYINNASETIFIHDNNIFLGTRWGMMVYSLSDPVNPQYKASFSHIYSCDPVVVQDHIAYVTLRGGNECGSTVNRLDVYTLSENYENAASAYSYNMTEPYGLAIDDEILFVCDGTKGLQIFDASDISVIDKHKLASFPDIKAYDVIPFEDHLFMIGSDGFYQYDYSDINNIHEISKIPVKKGIK